MGAENQSNVRASYKKFYRIRKLICGSFSEKFHYDMMFSWLSNVLKFGDTQPAIVYSAKPLVVSAYSDELDAVLFLSFPDELTDKYELNRGDRLTAATVYTEFGYGEPANDIDPGEKRSGKYIDFVPVIQLFCGANDEKIKAKTALFDEETWSRVTRLTEERAAHPTEPRQGFYFMKLPQE